MSEITPNNEISKKDAVNIAYREKREKINLELAQLKDSLKSVSEELKKEKANSHLQEGTHKSLSEGKVNQLKEKQALIRRQIRDAQSLKMRFKTPPFALLQAKREDGLRKNIQQNAQLQAKSKETQAQLEAEREGLKAKLAEIGQECEKLKNKESLEVQNLRRKISEVNGKINENQKTLSAQQAEVRNLYKTAAVRQVAVEKNDEIYHLKNQLAFVKLDLKEKIDLLDAYKKGEEREAQMQKKLKSLQVRAEKLKIQSEEKPDDMFLKTDCEEIKLEITAIEKEIDNFEQNKDEEIRILNERKSQLEADQLSLTAKINELKAKYGASAKTATEIVESEELKAAKAKATQTEAEIAKFNGEKAGYDSKLGEIHAELKAEAVRNNREAEYNESVSKIEDAHKRFDACEKELLAVEKKLEEAKAHQQWLIRGEEVYTKAFQEEQIMEKWRSDNAALAEKMDTEDKLLIVKNLKKYFTVEKSFFGKPTRYLRAVDDISFTVKAGTTMGIVGESGCGKTTMGRAILRLHEITDGEVIFDGNHIERLHRKDMRALRTKMQIIFQDPYSSLSPRMPVGEIIGEAVRTHNIVPKKDYKEYIIDIMKQCGLQPHYFSRYPHEFSGGQRQRICIARALAVQPKLVICDEPVSALDVSIQAQIINLLEDLQRKNNLTYVFISHDLSVVEHISDEIGVMYLGSLVESGSKEKIFSNPMHPYTRALFSAVPVPDPNVQMNRIVLQGDIPSPSRPPKGCKFHTRCPECMDKCKLVPPIYREYEPGHSVACHLYSQSEE